MKADRHSRSEATAGIFLFEKLWPGEIAGRQLTFSAGEESEESAGVTPAEPVPGLDQTLVLGVGTQLPQQVGLAVGEPVTSRTHRYTRVSYLVLLLYKRH